MARQQRVIHSAQQLEQQYQIEREERLLLPEAPPTTVLKEAHSQEEESVSTDGPKKIQNSSVATTTASIHSSGTPETASRDPFASPNTPPVVETESWRPRTIRRGV